MNPTTFRRIAYLSGAVIGLLQGLSGIGVEGNVALANMATNPPLTAKVFFLGLALAIPFVRIPDLERRPFASRFGGALMLSAGLAMLARHIVVGGPALEVYMAVTALAIGFAVFKELRRLNSPPSRMQPTLPHQP